MNIEISLEADVGSKVIRSMLCCTSVCGTSKHLILPRRELASDSCLESGMMLACILQEAKIVRLEYISLRN